MEKYESKIIPLLLAVFICAMAYAGGPSAPGTGGLGSPGYIDPAVPRWQDLRVSLFSTTTGSTQPPTWAKLTASGTSQGIWGWAFTGTGTSPNAEKELYGSTQLPHGFIKSGFHPHIHWMPTETTQATVAWGLEYSVQNVGSPIQAVSSVTYAIQKADGVAYKHQLVEFPEIPATTIKDSAIIVFRLFRNAEHASDTYEQNAVATDLDFHYETNVLGSTGEYGDN